MNCLHVQMIYITELYDCVNSYTVINLYVLYTFVCFDMFHILLSGDSLRNLWNVHIYIYVCMYVCVYVCMCVCVCIEYEVVTEEGYGD